MSPQSLLGLAALSLAFATTAVAAPKTVKDTQSWKGSVADEALQSMRPANGAITTARAFEEIVKAWNVAEKVPAVDFEKELVLVETTSGSRLNLSAILTEEGDLKGLGLATRDLRPGFRYMLIAVPRDGVISVNGMPLPKK